MILRCINTLSLKHVHPLKGCYVIRHYSTLTNHASKLILNSKNNEQIHTNKEHSFGYVYRFPSPATSPNDLIAKNDSVVGMKLMDLSQFTETRFTSDVLPPTLSYGLDRVIKEKGVHPLQSFERKAFNFPPSLKKVHQPSEVQLEKLPQFITTSRDPILHNLAKQQQAIYKGSTSSTTGALSQIYYAFSHYKPVQINMLTSKFQTTHLSAHFTPASVKPISLFLRYNDGIYSIDSDQGTNARGNQILLDLGKTLEKVLTTETDQFEKLLTKNKGNHVEAAHQDSYVYLKLGKSLLRSQIDCHSPFLGEEKNTFDLKTRAASAVRIDVRNYQRHTNYRINKLIGLEQSYEKEYYDMIRSSFLKYYFQTRIGNMAGIFVAYHNTSELFGFEFITTDEIAETVFGTTYFAEESFKITNYLLQVILDGVTQRLGNSKTIRLTFATDKSSHALNIFAIQVENDSGWAEPTASITTTTNFSETNKQRLERYRKQIESVNTPVYWFQLNILTIINGIKVRGHVSLTPDDSYQLYYKLHEITAKDRPYSDILNNYVDTLRLSKLYNEFDE
eukprot:TRINITY_DN6102_c0_g1_i2.p1 TRINITY_DN6102_c0_g1~~TRINITY_DN6102_c0_g1_i2.p1  ORF type:complete len:562 (+),score=84.03 TRINITY_DN6102_c0_g1_i2:184-1869(+)